MPKDIEELEDLTNENQEKVEDVVEYLENNPGKGYNFDEIREEFGYSIREAMHVTNLLEEKEDDRVETYEVGRALNETYFSASN